MTHATPLTSPNKPRKSRRATSSRGSLEKGAHLKAIDKLRDERLNRGSSGIREVRMFEPAF
jgi:hypothetical protein